MAPMQQSETDTSPHNTTGVEVRRQLTMLYTKQTIDIRTREYSLTYDPILIG